MLFSLSHHSHGRRTKFTTLIVARNARTLLRHVNDLVTYRLESRRRPRVTTYPTAHNLHLIVGYFCIQLRYTISSNHCRQTDVRGDPCLPPQGSPDMNISADT